MTTPASPPTPPPPRPAPTTTVAVPPPSGPYRLPPRPPNAVERALTEAWSAGRAPVPRRTAVGASILGLTGGWVLIGHQPGLGVAVLAAAFWLPVAGTLRRRPAADLITVALTIALVAVVAVRDAPWVVALCLLAAALLAASTAASARTLLAHLLAPATAAYATVRAMPWAARGVARLAGSRRGQLRVAARSVAVTVVILVVFGALLAGADQVFASYLRVDLGTLPARAVVATVVAVLALGLAHLTLAPPPWRDVRMPRPRPAGLGEWLLPIIALDVLLLGFLGVQAAALVGGHTYVQATTGLTYAEYARGGFWQLLGVTALTVLVVALAAQRAPRRTRREGLLVRATLGVLCLATLAVVASALRRMDLYVDAYGLTRLRVLVVAVEIGLAVLLVLLMVAGVRWRGTWLPRASLHVGAVTLLALALMNPDALVARHNTAPEFEGERDASYLRGLSADAVPVLTGLAEPLRSCVLSEKTALASPGPVEWNLGRARAAEALASISLTPAAPGCAWEATVTRAP